MTSNNSPAENTAVLDISSSTQATKARKKRAGKVQLPSGSEEWLAARLFHSVKAVQKDLFHYLVCHRKEFCEWLKFQYATSPQKQQLGAGVDTLFRQANFFDSIAGFTICVLDQKAATPASPIRVISKHPFVALPPAHAQFKVIPVEVIFRSLQEVLGLSQMSLNMTGQTRKYIVANIQARKISLATGARLLAVSERTVSRLRLYGESSYSTVTDYQLFCELLGHKLSRKEIAAKYSVRERTIWNVEQRILNRLLLNLINKE